MSGFSQNSVDRLRGVRVCWGDGADHLDNRHPLLEVSEHVREHGSRDRVAVVFDLDSTLFCVSPRTRHILQMLGGEPEFAIRFADAAAILRSIEVLPTDYSVKEVLARTRIEPNHELVRHVRDYWRRHFFSSHFLDRDQIYPSANDYVTHLHRLGAQVLYLTGREERPMRTGTLSALGRWGFPLFDPNHLRMKPTGLDSDEKFKVQVMQEFVKSFDHVWFFENEPVIIEDVRKAFPQVHIVFVNSAHSGKAPAPVGLRTIAPDFSLGGWLAETRI